MSVMRSLQAGRRSCRHAWILLSSLTCFHASRLHSCPRVHQFEAITAAWMCGVPSSGLAGLVGVCKDFVFTVGNAKWAT